MIRNLIAALLFAALSASHVAGHAAEVAGVKFDETMKVGAGETAPLLLNGAGLRGVLFIKAYAMALYLPQKAATTAEVLGQKGAKRIRIVPLRELTAEQFADALVGGIRKNHSEQEIAPLAARVETFKTTMLGLNATRKGALIHLDWLPEVGGGVTRLTIDGEKKGEDIAGEDFYRAILKIWLGDHPAAGDLKEALLGKRS